MAAVSALLFATAAGVTVVIAATALVIAGVRDEEKRGTIADKRPPTIPALLARRVLGTYAHLTREDQPEPDSPCETPSAGKHRAGPSDH
jgi:hypothetical protein